MSVLTQIVQDLWSFYLCIKAAPSVFKSEEGNAIYHLEKVCLLCPQARRLTRDVDGSGECWWESNWLNSNYDIPRNFSPANYVRASFGLPTKLDRFRK